MRVNWAPAAKQDYPDGGYYELEEDGVIRIRFTVKPELKKGSIILSPRLVVMSRLPGTVVRKATSRQSICAHRVASKFGSLAQGTKNRPELINRRVRFPLDRHRPPLFSLFRRRIAGIPSPYPHAPESGA